MSIDAVHLRNFRGYKDVTLNLAPLTVLLGSNSSGKSSFSHPLAALAHCQQLYAGERQASMTPVSATKAEQWPVDLGGYEDLVTQGCTDRVYIGLHTSEGWVEFGFGGVPTAPNDLWLSYLAFPRDLRADTSSVTVAPIPDGSPSPTPPGSTVDIGPGTNASLQPSEVPNLVLERINEQEWRHQGELASLGLDGLFPLNLLHKRGTEIIFNWKAPNEIRSLLKGTTYLRASRKRPSRGYERFRSEQKSLGYAGEKTASVLLNRGTQESIFISPPPSISAIRNEDFQIRWGEQVTTLQSATGEWLKHLQLAEHVQVLESRRYGSEYVDIRVILKRGGASRDITEVGFGISQVLPILVGALLQPKDSLFIVDLPEAHLHPGPQADIADLFCSMAMSGRSALVETHSEMFFHRLRLRAAMDPELMKRIAVYFVDAPSSDEMCKLPRRVGLSFEEELKWPAGFLRDALDSEIQLGSVRESRKKT